MLISNSFSCIYDVPIVYKRSSKSKSHVLRHDFLLKIYHYNHHNFQLHTNCNFCYKSHTHACNYDPRIILFAVNIPHLRALWCSQAIEAKFIHHIKNFKSTKKYQKGEEKAGVIASNIIIITSLHLLLISYICEKNVGLGVCKSVSLVFLSFFGTVPLLHPVSVKIRSRM